MENPVGAWAEALARKTDIAQVHSASELIQSEHDRVVAIIDEVEAMKGIGFASHEEWEGYRKACVTLRSAIQKGRE